MPVSELVALKAGIDLAKAVKDWVPKRDGDALLQDKICLALRELYFTPNGVMDLLRKLDSGEEVSEFDLRYALLEFNDGQPNVDGATELLSFERLSGELGLNLRT